MKYRLAGYPLFIALICCGLVPIAASETSYAESGDESVDHVVETRLASPLIHSIEDERYASGFVSRVKVGELFSQGKDLSGALLFVPGVHVSSQAGVGQSSFAMVRGGNPRQVTVILDGIRVAAPVGMGFDLGRLGLSGIESADIFRGGAAGVFGSGGVTGAIHLQTHQPPTSSSDSSLPQNEAEQSGAVDLSLTTLAGSFGTFGAAGRTRLTRGNYKLHLNAAWRQSEGDYAFIDDQNTAHQRMNNDHRRLSVLGGGEVELSDDEFLQVTLSFDQGFGGSAGPGEFQERFSTARVGDDRVFSSLRWHRRNMIQTNGFALDANAYIGGQIANNHYHNAVAFFTRDAFEQDATHRSLNGGVRTTSIIAANMLTVLSYLELDGRLEDYLSTTTAHQIDSLSATRQTVSAALSNELVVAKDMLSIIGGIRQEIIRDIASEATTTPTLFSGGLIFRAHKYLRLNSNIAQTFRMPDFDELYLQTESTRGNKSLEPEQALMWDVGLNIGREDGVVASQLVYFENHIDSMILFLPVNAYMFEAQNLQGAFSSGVEGALLVNPHRRVHTRATYTFTNAYLLDLMETPLPHQPRHRATFFAEWQLGPWALWEYVDSMNLYGSANYRSAVFFDQFANLKNPYSLTFDAGLRAEINSWMQLRFDMHNILDYKQAQDSLQRPLPGRAFYMSLQLSQGGS